MKRCHEFGFVLAAAMLLMHGCGGPPESKPVDARDQAETGNLITLVARCKAKPPTEAGRCNNLVAAVEAANSLLASRGDDHQIRLETIQDDKSWGDYKTEFELASDAGQAPDIIVSGHEHVGDWASAGLILPVTRFLGLHPEFDDVMESLWKATEWRGNRWGIPQDADARLFFYSKILLRKLGWTPEQIESLPERVLSGDFDMDALFDTAEEAVRKGVVKPGRGWWHRPLNGPDFLTYYLAEGGQISTLGGGLTFDRKAALSVYRMLYAATQERGILSPALLGMEWNEWNSVVSAADQVLFWFGGSWNWADWASNYVQDRGGKDYLLENIGFAALPAGRAGAPHTLTHPLLYMISAHSAHPELAMLVIAKATTKELNTAYAVESGHLGILKSQLAYGPYAGAGFIAGVTPLLRLTTFLPNDPAWSAWSEAFYLGIQAVESGDLRPAAALEVTVDRLENEAGGKVMIQ